MSTGDPAVGMNAAANKPLDIKSECDELKDEVEKEDAVIQEMRSAPGEAQAHMATTVTSSKATCAGKVVSTKPAYSSLASLPASAQGNYAQGVRPAYGGYEGREARPAVPADKAKGIKRKPAVKAKPPKPPRPADPSNMCEIEGEPFRHGVNGTDSGCTHTEARLIEDLFKSQGTTGAKACELVMKIKWKQRSLLKDDAGIPILKDGKKVWKEDPPRDVPCADFCERTICHAMRCGLKVSLCKDDGDKQRKANAADEIDCDAPANKS